MSSGKSGSTNTIMVDTTREADMVMTYQARVPALAENVEQLGRYLVQMGQMLSVMQARMDEMEARQAQVTIRHADAKKIMALIRARAAELCRKYSLEDPKSAAVLRAAMKKDVLKRYAVKDLHDIPAAGLSGAENLIGGWTNIRLIMERRGSK